MSAHIGIVPQRKARSDAGPEAQQMTQPEPLPDAERFLVMDRKEKLAVARDQIARGERHIKQQRAIISRLSASGADTALAQDLLRAYETALAGHRQHLAYIQRHFR